MKECFIKIHETHITFILGNFTGSNPIENGNVNETLGKTLILMLAHAGDEEYSYRITDERL